MNNFVYTVGISCTPLHEKAVESATEVGLIEVKRGKKKPSILDASTSIQMSIGGDSVSNANT